MDFTAIFAILFVLWLTVAVIRGIAISCQLGKEEKNGDISRVEDRSV